MITEKVDSRERVIGAKTSVTMRYLVSGHASDTDARAELLAGTPPFYENLVRDECTLEPLFVDTVTGQGTWDCAVRYVAPELSPPQVGESSVAFDTGGGTQHITQSRQTLLKFPETAPDFKGAIGVTHESVEGVDITVPVYNFSETHYFSEVSLGYRMTLFALTGKINSGSFRGLGAGECLFLGAAGSQRGAELWEVTFRFAASPNRSDIPVGDLTVSHKLGWDYLWVRYADSEDTASHTLVKKPIAAYVERVYEMASFGVLGIGS